MKLDIEQNRRVQKWSLKEQVGRLLWDLAYPVFRATPRQFWVLRRIVLRAFGATIGSHVHIYPNVKIAIPWNLIVGDFVAVGDGAILYSLGKIELSKKVTVSQRAHICAGTHDYNDRSMKLEKPTVKVEEGAWVCAEAFVGPGVTIGEFSIVGARAVLTKSLAPAQIAAGNPAKIVGSR